MCVSDADVEAIAAEMGMDDQGSGKVDDVNEPSEDKAPTDQNKIPSSNKEQDTMATGEAKESSSANANKGGKKSKKKKKGNAE